LYVAQPGSSFHVKRRCPHGVVTNTVSSGPKTPASASRVHQHRAMRSPALVPLEVPLPFTPLSQLAPGVREVPRGDSASSICARLSRAKIQMGQTHQPVPRASSGPEPDEAEPGQPRDRETLPSSLRLLEHRSSAPIPLPFPGRSPREVPGWQATYGLTGKRPARQTTSLWGYTQAPSTPRGSWLTRSPDEWRPEDFCRGRHKSCGGNGFDWQCCKSSGRRERDGSHHVLRGSSSTAILASRQLETAA
jgi:hypothetical protein